MRPRVAVVSLVAGIAIGAAAAAPLWERLHHGPGPPAPTGRPVPTPAPAAAGTPGFASDDVYIDPAMIQNLGVRSAQVEERVITESIRTTGYVDYDQERVVNCNARISGWIEKLYVAYVGKRVRKGQRLLEIYSPELVLTEEDYLRSRDLAEKNGGAAATARYGQNLTVAAEERLRLMGIASSEIARLAKTGRVSQSAPLEAAASGVVTQIKAAEGAYVRVGDDLYTIADLSRVWVYADVYERDLPEVRLGQKAQVTSDARAGHVFQGNVEYIYPNVNEQTRMVRVRLEFANPGGLLKPGMYVKTTLVDESPEKRLAVPTEAVLDSGVRHVVIVDRGEGHFAPREIRIGPESGGYYPVLDGLRSGERVVTSAQFLIDSESNLHEALGAMALSRGSRTPSDGATPGPER